MNQDLFIVYLEHLFKRCKGKVIIILDNASYHKAGRVIEYLQGRVGWIELVYLPKYAPELNPMELVWSFLKTRELNRVTVKDKQEFTDLVYKKIYQVSQNEEKCRSFFRKDELKYIGEASQAA